MLNGLDRSAAAIPTFETKVPGIVDSSHRSRSVCSASTDFEEPLPERSAEELAQDSSIEPPDRTAVLEGSDLRASIFGHIEGEMEFVGLECPLTKHRTMVHTDCLDCESSVAAELKDVFQEEGNHGFRKLPGMEEPEGV